MTAAGEATAALAARLFSAREERNLNTELAELTEATEKTKSSAQESASVEPRASAFVLNKWAATERHPQAFFSAVSLKPPRPLC